MLQTIKKRRSQAGFTLVELLIVIVVIAILAAIAITAFSGVQAGARDTQRESDMAQVKQSLEVYYNEEGQYPAQNEIVNATSANVLGLLDGIEEDALTDPRDEDGGNSFTAATSGEAGVYGYQCNNATTNDGCQSYILTYWSEENDDAVEEVDVAGEEPTTTP